MSLTIPRESRQDIGTITVLDGTTPVTTYEVALTLYGATILEADWGTPDIIGTDRTVIVGPGSSRVLAPGTYVLSARYTSGTLQPVVKAIVVVSIT